MIDPIQFAKEAGIPIQLLRQFQGYQSRVRKQIPKHQILLKDNTDEAIWNEYLLPKKVTFQNHYLKLMEKHPKIDSIKQIILLLKQLHSIIKQQGGIVKISSYGEWFKVAQTLFEKKDNLSNGQNLNQMKVYQISKQYLFPYIFAKIYRKKQITQYQLSFFRPQFIRDKQFINYFNNLQQGIQLYKCPIINFVDCQKQTHLNIKLLNLDTIAQLYGDNIIDIRVQKPCDVGFIAQKLQNSKYQMSIKDYREYQKIYQTDKLEQFKHYPIILNQKIFFGVNFDAQNKGEHDVNKQIISKLSNSFLGCKQSFDMLSYLDQDIPGCTLPQIYFKVNGCWTGGHQQNVNMSAVNINHGPDSSEWYAIENKYVDILREKIKEEKGVDLLLTQGLWFENLKYFCDHNIPITKIIQKKGDIILSGPGTLHWVRSYGVSMQSAWNVMTKDLNQIQLAINRHRENIKINFSRRNIIPLKSLFLKYLNHQHQTMPKQNKAKVLKTINQWFNNEKNALNKLKSIKNVKVDVKHIRDLDSFCILCKQQPLIYYLKDDQNKEAIKCIHCTQLQREKITIYSKYKQEDVQYLLQVVANQSNNLIMEIRSLCTGIHIGKTKCFNKSQMIEDKINFQFTPIKTNQSILNQIETIKNEGIKQTFNSNDSQLLLENNITIFKIDEEKYNLYQVEGQTKNNNNNLKASPYNRQQRNEDYSRSRQKSYQIKTYNPKICRVNQKKQKKQNNSCKKIKNKSVKSQTKTKKIFLKNQKINTHSSINNANNLEQEIKQYYESNKMVETQKKIKKFQQKV